jgi:hypothetical protein
VSEWINKMRRKLAGAILGEQGALFLPDEYRSSYEGGYYERLPDRELAQVARYFFYVARNVNREIADERDIPAAVFTHSQAVMSVIRYAIEANAEVATFTQSGEIGGKDIGVWQVEVKRLGDDYDFSEPGVEETYAPGDPNKLVKLDMSFRLPLPTKRPKHLTDEIAGEEG